MDTIRQHLQTAFRDAVAALMAVHVRFTDDSLNQPPTTGSWSAGQIADHLIKGSVLPALLEHGSPAQRPLDAHVDGLRALFLDFNIHMESPGFVLPDAGPFAVTNQQVALTEICNQIMTILQSAPLDTMCGNDEGVGRLTRCEMAWFYTFHMMRHTAQMRKLPA